MASFGNVHSAQQPGEGNFLMFMFHHLQQWGTTLSHTLSAFLGQMPLAEDTVRLLRAMLLGLRDELPVSLRDLYRQSGASHLLALSGLHLGVLFGLFNYWLMHALHRRWRYVVGTLGLLFLWGYAFLTAFPVSLCRASLMLSLLVIGQMRLTGNDIWHTLGLSALVLLLIEPAMLFDVGFQLSFMAVVGIYLFYFPLAKAWVSRSRWVRWLWRIWVLSFAAQMGVLPLLLHYFHRVSLSGIVLSPLYILLATAIIYAALFILLLHPLGLAFLLCPLVEALVTIQHTLMSLSLCLSWSGVEGVRLPWSHVLLLYAALFCLLPSLHVLANSSRELPQHRLALFFRSWPTLLAFLLLLFSAFLLP